MKYCLYIHLSRWQVFTKKTLTIVNIVLQMKNNKSKKYSKIFQTSLTNKSSGRKIKDHICYSDKSTGNKITDTDLFMEFKKYFNTQTWLIVLRFINKSFLFPVLLIFVGSYIMLTGNGVCKIVHILFEKLFIIQW